MRKILLVALVLFGLILPAVPILLDIQPVAAATGTSYNVSNVAGAGTGDRGGEESYQRSNFYANGRWWVFYSDGTDMVYSSSTDGMSWDGYYFAVNETPFAENFAVHFDGTYVHCVKTQTIVDDPLVYRMGTPVSNGTITWATPDTETIMAANPAEELRKPVVTTTANGHPWVAFDYCAAGAINAYVMESSTYNGTWTTAAGSPHNLFSDLGCKATSLIPVTTGNDLYAFYNDVNKELYMRHWNGAAWAAAECITNGDRLVAEPFYSAVRSGDVISVMWYHYQAPATYQILFSERTIGGSWGNNATILAAGAAITNWVSLTRIDDTGNLAAFYHHASRIYYRLRLNGVWDATATEWLLPSNGYVHASVVSHLVGGQYTVGVQFYGLRLQFAMLDLALPIISTEAASSVALSTARLNSVIDWDGGSDVVVRFGWGTTSQAAIEAYDDFETVAGNYSQGEHPYLDVDSLSANTTYYFRSEAQNDSGGDLGSQLSFTTAVNLTGSVQNFKGIPAAESISLSWSSMSGATDYLVRYKSTDYPVSIVDGIQAYLGGSTSIVHEGLTPGTTYYYSLWATSGGAYSLPAATLMLTTTAGASDGDLPSYTPPSEIPRWLGGTDYTNVSNLGFVYNITNGVADSLEMPRGNFWFFSWVIIAAAGGLVAFIVSKGKLLVAAIIMTIVLFVGWTMMLVPFWIPLIGGILILGFFVAHKEVARG